eukprot:3587505-Lingulodinium_polyedra.AAC.1
MAHAGQGAQIELRPGLEAEVPVAVRGHGLVLVLARRSSAQVPAARPAAGQTGPPQGRSHLARRR